MKTKIYVVEDMAYTRIALVEKLKEANFEVVGSAAKAEVAWLEMQNISFDLALLDINLAGAEDGVWLAEKIRTKIDVAIIFLTAHSDATTLDRVLAVNPNGFLMKPFNKPSLLTTIDIALKAFKKEVLLQKTNDAYVMIEIKNHIVKLHLNEILYLQSDANYINIQTIAEQISIREKLKIFLENLPKNNFIVQAHLRFAVNKNYITSITPNSVLIDKIEIPVSKTYKNQIF